MLSIAQNLQVGSWKELYEKFKCYCASSGGALGASISSAEAKVPAVGSSIEQAEAQKVQLEQDLYSPYG